MSRMSMNLKTSIYSMSSVDIERDVKKLTYVSVTERIFYFSTLLLLIIVLLLLPRK